jgi:hypothetical protein
MNIQDEKPRIRVRAGTAADIKRELTKAADKIDDLLDVVDVPAVSDMFNQNDKGNQPRVATGPAQSASGSGAEKMVSDYADGAEQTGLSAAYEAFARELANQGKRVESVEKSVVAIAGLLSAAIKGESFPQDETKEKGDEDDEKEDTAKGIPTLNIPGLMRSLSNASRDTGKLGLQAPPSMSVVKARRNSLQDILDQDDGSTYSMSTRMELASIQSAIAQLDSGMMRDSHLNNLVKRASGPAREALMKAGITF